MYSYPEQIQSIISVDGTSTCHVTSAKIQCSLTVHGTVLPPFHLLETVPEDVSQHHQGPHTPAVRSRQADGIGA